MGTDPFKTRFFRCIGNCVSDVRIIANNFPLQLRHISMHFLLLMSWLGCAWLISSFIDFSRLPLKGLIEPILHRTDVVLVVFFCVEVVIQVAMSVYRDTKQQWRELQLREGQTKQAEYVTSVSAAELEPSFGSAGEAAPASQDSGTSLGVAMPGSPVEAVSTNRDGGSGVDTADTPALRVGTAALNGDRGSGMVAPSAARIFQSNGDSHEIPAAATGHRPPDSEFIKLLTAAIKDRTDMMLSGLADPVTIYRGEESLYNALTATMEQLVAGHTVFAICTDKTWDAEPVKWYLDANARAKARGVSITRIFYEMRGNVASEAQKQADQGINVLLLRAEKLSELKPIHCVPPHLGIAIINEKTVFLHSGLGDEAVACRYECPHLASVIRSEFEVVERVSDPVDPRIPSVQPDKTVWHEHVIP